MLYYIKSKWGGAAMQKEICYKKLFKLMIDRNLKGHDLRDMAGISQSTYCKLQHDRPVSTQMLVRICSALECELWDIAELVDRPGQGQILKKGGIG